MVYLSGNNCLAYDSYEVDTGNYTYNFSIFNSGEVIGSGENSMTADFNIPQDLRYPIFTSAKHWGERFTGFFQTMLRNGGRTGVSLSAGLRWTIGK